jgi:MarR family transcriptional regulator, organic hydroperoxide resistance regulator
MAKGQRLDDQLCFALYAASRAMTRAYQPLLEPLGLTYPQYLTLLALWEEDGQRVSALGERLRLDSATLTPLLKRLEAQGLVTRRRSEHDERVVEISLTEAGWDMQRRAEHLPVSMLCQTGLELGELVALREQLRALTARLRA